MNTLFRKDLRLNRTVIVIASALLVTPYLVAAVFAVNESYASSIPIHRSWPNLLLAANHFCLMYWPVAAALLGGNAFASERADRSAEFLAYLPPTRQQIACSKFAVVCVVTTVFWSLNLVLFGLGRSHIGDDTFQYLDLSEAFPKTSFAAVGMLTFGVSWCASAVLNSTGPAVVMGLGAPIGLSAGLQFTGWLLGWPHEDHLGRWFTHAGISLGLIAFVIGWHLFLSRHEP